MSGLLVAGTSSDAGKSVVVTGLCRALRRRGIDVAPFKAQNMSNNSMVCPNGAEIGRAQYLQAQAAGVTPTALLNPVLLKPGTDRRSHIVLLGQPAGELRSGEYATGRTRLAQAAFDSFEQLSSQHDLIICEGAGSPAEINLRAGDYVNMGLARQFDLPVVVVGDIDRGGVLASIYGTWALLQPADRALLKGYLINKFRGDLSVLTPGLTDIDARTGLDCLGVLPWLDEVWIDGEDALQVARWGTHPGDDSAQLVVAVVRLPRISNSTDVEAMAGEPGVQVEVTTDPAVCRAADLLVLPGSRASVDDLAWLRRSGIAQVVVERATTGRPVLGVCGGYEMLAHRIDDSVESHAGVVDGLGVLPVEVVFTDVKTVTRSHYRWGELDVPGYEIHHGCCRPIGSATRFLDGVQVGASYGTMLHGALENDDFRRAWLTDIATQVGSSWRPDLTAIGHQARREQMIERLADALGEYADVDRILDWATIGGHR